MELPEDIKEQIKVFAQTEWPDDYEMQAHVIEKQSDSFFTIAQYYADMEEHDIFKKAFSKAVTEWPVDFEMQLHTLQKQMDSAIEFGNYNPPNSMPKEIWENIFFKAINEWPDDYEMQLHTAEKQVESWLAIQ